MGLGDLGFINDMPRGWTRSDKLNKKCHSVWFSIARRCYNVNDRSYKRYGGIGVYVCDEWKLLSNFSKWYLDNYVEGYHIDKDISGFVDSEGFKCYSPKSCVFVPPRDNAKDARSRQGAVTEVSGYETKPVGRKDFRIFCSTNGSDPQDFEEIWLGDRVGKKGSKLFVYYHKDSKSERPKGVGYTPLNKEVSTYENISITRGNFKDFCNHNSLVFEEFEEVWIGEVKNNCSKLFLYFHKDSETPRPVGLSYIPPITDVFGYETKPVQRSNFKRYCVRNSLSISEFYEVLSGVQQGRIKRYYYIHYSRCVEEI